jgi:Fe2+ or Zn2+ uptake regulation protein
MTIYRALDCLVERGLARKIASLNAFVALTEETRAAIGAFVTCANSSTSGARTCWSRSR